MIKKAELKLTQDWDKTFEKSNSVNHSKVTFVNRYGITLAADMYVPKNAQGKLPAIAVSGPFGAVKEQCSGLYAQTMAERGFLTIAFDPSFTGESGGEPRYMASPDINTEDFMAAVDFLSLNEKVDADRIGIIGICGWGGMAINTAALDTRIKATVSSTMYDMTRVNAKGYFDSEDSEESVMRQKRLCARSALRITKTAHTSLLVAWLTRFPRTRRSSLKIITIITKPKEAIIRARSIQTEDGMSLAANPLSISRFCSTATKSAAP